MTKLTKCPILGPFCTKYKQKGSFFEKLDCRFLDVKIMQLYLKNQNKTKQELLKKMLN